MTGLCYAELASRFPEASGAVAYVKQGFGSDRAAQLTGVALTLAVAIAAASIASGAVHYLSLLIGLPPTALIALLVATFTLLAIAGVRESIGFAAVIGAVEILGLARCRRGRVPRRARLRLRGHVAVELHRMARRRGRRLHCVLRLHRL